MNTHEAVPLCFTKNVVFLEPTEHDAMNGITYQHPELVVPVGSRVRIIERLRYGACFAFGHRTGCAPYENFTHFSVDENWPAPPSREELDGPIQTAPKSPAESGKFVLGTAREHSQSIKVDKSGPIDLESGSVEQRRGEDLDDLNNTLQAMQLGERPTAASTPLPVPIHRPRGVSGSSVSQKRPKADSTMLDASDVVIDTKAIMTQFDTLGRQLTQVIHDAVLHVNTNTNNALSAISTAIQEKVFSCHQNCVNHQSSVQADILKQVKHSQAIFQKQQQELLSKFTNLAQSTHRIGENIAKQSMAQSVVTTMTPTPQKAVNFSEPEAPMSTSSHTTVQGVAGCSYLPPSSNASALQAELATDEDRATQDALKFIRTHPEKVPKWYDSQTEMCMALFCCKKLYKFAKRQALQKVCFLDRWLGYAFENVEERMLMHLNSVRQEFPQIGLFRTLQELARKMCPDDFVSLDKALGTRKAGETLVDFAIRLYTDIPICKNISEAEIPKTALEYIRLHERDENINMELRRELLNRNNGFGIAEVTKEELLEIMEKVDRLRKLGRPTSKVHAAEVGYTPKESASQIDNSEVLSAIYGLHNKMNQQTTPQRSTRGTCKTCERPHNNLRPSGVPYPYCDSCYKKVRASGTLKSKNKGLYAKPPITAAVCEVCKGAVELGRSGKPFKKCDKCFKNRSISNIKEYSEIRLEDIDNRLVRSMAGILKPHSICKYRGSGRYAEDKYRLAVSVFNSKKTKDIVGLFDTGCNTECLSERACAKLGITHLIKPARSRATGVDNRPLPVVGEVEALLHIGNAPYKANFQVLKNVSGYDMMIGTRFMINNNHMMDRILDTVTDTLGKENVWRGN